MLQRIWDVYREDLNVVEREAMFVIRVLVCWVGRGCM